MDLRDIKEFFIDSLKFIMFFVLMIVFFLYIVSFQRVIGTSMISTINDNDLILVCKFNYLLFDIKHKDIVSLKDSDGKTLIKRIIGIPGDKIEIKDNKLYINSKLIKEEYLSKDTLTEDYILNDYEEIPEDMYFVMGDNRINSLDSREFGLVKKNDIKGKVCLRVLPISKLNIF